VSSSTPVALHQFPGIRLTPPPRRRHPPSPLATRQPPSVLTCRPPLLSPSTNPVASVLMPPPRRHHPPFSPRDARRVSPDPEVRLHDPTMFSPQSASQSPIANSQPPTPPNSPIQVLGCRISETFKVLKGGQEPSR
jgi:hypothetical protein